MELEEIFTRGAFRQLGGSRFFERGAAYAASGRVKKLKAGHGEVTATVRGRHPYQVRLWVEDGGPGYSCTCPVGTEGLFCKHCVAVGLAFTSRKHRAHDSDAPDEPGAIDLRSHLDSLPKEALVELLVEQARDDEFLRGRVLLDAAKKVGAIVDLDDFRVAIQTVFDAGDFVDYRSMYAYSSGIQEVVDSVETLLEEGHAAEVVELSEHALTCLEDALGRVDDSDGYMGGSIRDRICELHHEACVVARPDPEQLAKRLFEWELYSEWETFYGAVETYADVLGSRGIEVFRRLAEEVWAKVPAITSRDERDRSHSSFRFNITHIMEALARVTGDVEALVAVKSRDLSYAYHYVEIADLYRKEGRFDDALKWAEKGVSAFPMKTDVRLLEVLADEYHRRGRHDDVLRLMWDAFAELPAPSSYRRLSLHATRAGAWDEWRPKALDLIRTSISRRKRDGPAPSRWVRTVDHSDLVEVFLGEGDLEAAWAEAQAGGCSDALWMRLAALREADHPVDAFPLYQAEVERVIGQKNNRAYADAVEVLRKIKALMERAGHGDEFPTYLESVRATHKPKRNLMNLIQQSGL